MVDGMIRDVCNLHYDGMKKKNYHMLEQANNLIETLNKLCPNDPKIAGLGRYYSLLPKSYYQSNNINYTITMVNDKLFTIINNFRLNKYMPKYVHQNNTLMNEHCDKMYLFCLISDFLLATSPEMYNLYMRLLQDGRIFIRNDNTKANMMNISESSCNGSVNIISIEKHRYWMFLNKMQNIGDCDALIHELAHIYYFMYNNVSDKDLSCIKDTIKFEVFPRTMELLFINYLERNGLIKESAFVKELYAQRVINDMNTSVDKLRQRYSLADFVALQAAEALEKGYVSIDDYCKIIYETSYKTLLKDSSDYFKVKTKK